MGSVSNTSITPINSIISLITLPNDACTTELDPATYNNTTMKAYWMWASYNRSDKFAVENKEEEKKNKTMRFVVYPDRQVINKVWVDAICWNFHIA